MSFETYYCHDPTCEGRNGFQVRWFPSSWNPPMPPEPERDTCPYCGDEMEEEPLAADPDEPPDESAYLPWNE